MLTSLAILFPFGEILYIHITPHIRIRFLDVLVLMFCIETILKQRGNVIQGIKKSGLIVLGLALFISALLNISTATASSLSYLLRTLLYFCFFGCILSITKHRKLNILFTCSVALLLASAFIQYFLYPSLRNLMYLGYDPHAYRLFGLFLDPNLIGLFLVWSLLYFAQKKQLFVSFFVLCALLLTYSRISYISGVISGIYLLFMYFRPRRAITFVILGILFLGALTLSLPKKQGEGTNLKRINSIVSKTNALTIVQKTIQTHALLGIGFNTLPTLLPKDTFINNSGYGLDNSFLTILVTSGIIGIFGYGVFFFTIMKKSTHVFRAITLAYFIHALSTNSFFTPTLFVAYGILYYLTLSDTSHASTSL